MDTIKLLQEWYAKNCDGDWEHSYGVSIDTLDNPGWRIDIDLIDTNLENKEFNKIKIYNDDNNWIFCEVLNGVFRGRGSIDKLEEILKVFLEWQALNNSKFG